MEITAWEQGGIFLGALLCGASVGLLYDLFRILRKNIKTNPILIGVQDIIFWTLSAIIVFFYIMIGNSGELRLYEILGVGIGAFLYNLILSRFIVEVLQIILRILKKDILFILKIVLTPIALVYKLFRRPLIIVANLSKEGTRKLSRNTAKKWNSVISSFKQLKKIKKKI